jgi:hypothetical protein
MGTSRNRMVTDKCIGTGLPLRIAGWYFHWRTASTAAFCRGTGPDTAFGAVTCPSTSITASTRTSPFRCWFFATNGYPGRTVHTETGCVDASVDCVFVYVVVIVGEAKVTSPGNVARAAGPAGGSDCDTERDAGGWLTAAVCLLRAGLEVLRRYDAPPAARTTKIAATALIETPFLFLVEARSGSVVFPLLKARPKVNSGGPPVSVPCAAADVAPFVENG